MFMPALGMIRRMGGSGHVRLGAEPTESIADLARRVGRGVREAYRYRHALQQLDRLDDRDLDDLALGRGDLPALAWRYAQAA